MTTLSTPTYSTAIAVAVILTTLSSASGAQEFTAGHLFAANLDAHEIVEFDAAGHRLRAFGGGSGLSNPYGLAFGPNGHLYVASHGNDSIIEFDATGTAVKTISGVGLDGPYALAFGPNGNLFVVSSTSDVLSELTPAGALVKDASIASYCDKPMGIALSPEGNIYVASDNSANIVEFDAELAYVRNVASIGDCVGLVWAGDGNLVTAGYSSGRKIFKVSLTGTVVKSYATGSSAFIHGIAMGPDGRVYAGANIVDKLFTVDLTAPSAVAMSTTGTGERLVGVAFAPQRFDAKITGKRALPGQDPKTITESCVISMSPFASWVMVQWNDDVVNALDLTTLFGADALVLQGRNVGGSKAEKQQFTGSQASRKTLDAGMASCVLAIQLAATETGHYALKKITGTIARDSGDGAFVGKVTSGKKRN
jgi:hypothetical protein